MSSIYEYTDTTMLHIAEATEWIDSNPELHNKIHSIGDSQQSYRTINHWENMGLLDDMRAEQGKGWRKFSFYEMSYIVILGALRGLGVPIEKLRKTKETLFASVFEARPDIVLLEVVVAFVYLKNYGNSHLLIESDGTAHFMPMEDFSLYKRHNLLPAGYILLNINQLLIENIKVGTGETFPIRTDLIAVLDEQEADVINNMRRETGIDKMTISLKNEGQKENWSPTVEKEFVVKPENNTGLHNVINTLGNGEIIVKIKDGKVVYTRAKKQTKKK